MLKISVPKYHKIKDTPSRAALEEAVLSGTSLQPHLTTTAINYMRTVDVFPAGIIYSRGRACLRSLSRRVTDKAYLMSSGGMLTNNDLINLMFSHSFDRVINQLKSDDLIEVADDLYPVNHQNEPVVMETLPDALDSLKLYQSFSDSYAVKTVSDATLKYHLANITRDFQYISIDGHYIPAVLAMYLLQDRETVISEKREGGTTYRMYKRKHGDEAFTLISPFVAYDIGEPLFHLAFN